MCGIVGYVGDRQAADFLLEGLSKLEYRGYDSAGVALELADGGAPGCTLDVVRSTGKVAGLEAIAYSGDRSGRRKVALMVQVPASFDPAQPCIVTATSSGSRGIYGAIGTAGEWGLKRGCAVAYTDKGTGSAPHDLMKDTVPLVDGTRTSAASPWPSPSSRWPCRRARWSARHCRRKPRH